MCWSGEKVWGRDRQDDWETLGKDPIGGLHSLQSASSRRTTRITNIKRVSIIMQIHIYIYLRNASIIGMK